MKPLLIIECRECGECQGRGTYKHGQSKHHSSGSPCHPCQGHGKMPTVLEFDAKKFICHQCNGNNQWSSHSTCTKCRADKGYLLPKKGEEKCANCCCIDRNKCVHFQGIHDGECDCRGYKRFHLTSDAVLMTVGDIVKTNLPEKQGIATKLIAYFMSKKSANPNNEKVVIVEGYEE